MYNFYAFLSRMKHIKRWGLMRNTETENIKEHSLDCAVIAHALALIKNRYFDGNTDAERVMAIAAFHEAGEVITGDLATPIKYFNPDIKKAYKAIEDVATRHILDMLPMELRGEYEPLLLPTDEYEQRIVKAADKLCAYIKCVEETKLGNEEFTKAKERIESDLRKISKELPEVAYFMENMLPGYSLTLDELN